MSLGLIAVLVAVSETATWHWLSAKTIGVIVVGLVLLAALGAERVAVGRAARRHADDADPRRLDDERRRAAARLRHVLVVHPRCRSTSRRPSARVRLRRVGHAGGPVPRADDARDAASSARRPGGSRGSSARSRRCSRAASSPRVVRPARRSRERAGRSTSPRPPRQRDRPGVRGDGEPDHRERRAGRRRASRPA